MTSTKPAFAEAKPKVQNTDVLSITLGLTDSLAQG